MADVNVATAFKAVVRPQNYAREKDCEMVSHTLRPRDCVCEIKSVYNIIPAPSKGCQMVPKGCQFTIP